MGVIDFIDLALDVKQSSDLHKARTQLTRLEEQAANETLRREFLQVLRNFVFSTGREIKELRSFTDSHPQPALVTARVLEWRLNDAGISPGIFPEFSDKEYVQTVNDSLNEIIHQTSDKLAPEERNQADRCIEAILGIPLLKQAIKDQSAREELEATQAEWQELENQNKSSSNRGLKIMGGALLAAAVFGCLSFFLASILLSLSEGVGALVGGLFVLATLVVFVGGMGWGIYTMVRNNNPRYQALKELRKQLQTEILDNAAWQEIERRFGSHNSQGYSQILTSNEALIGNVMGVLSSFKPMSLSKLAQTEGG